MQSAHFQLFCIVWVAPQQFLTAQNQPGAHCGPCAVEIKLEGVSPLTPQYIWPSATLLDVSCRVQLDAEGSYQCSITGLIFEVTGSARITYSLLSWSKYAQLVEKPWIVGGPLFDVRCSVPGALSSIQFPHCLCLGGEPGDRGWEGPLGVF